MNKGIYLAFEGGEGWGKSTQVPLLAQKLQEAYPDRKIITTREPGGCLVAENVRAVIMNKGCSEAVDSLTEVYLFATARAQSLRHTVAPVLKEGGIVISDRTFYSSLAYQGFGREIGWEKVWEINRLAVGEIKPNLVFLLDGSPEIALARITKNERETNRLDEEKLTFHQKVREGFLFLKSQQPERFVLIDGTLGIEQQAETIWREFQLRFSDPEIKQEIWNPKKFGKERF